MAVLGGVDALLEAAKFVELQSKLKNGYYFSELEELPSEKVSSSYSSNNSSQNRQIISTSGSFANNHTNRDFNIIANAPKNPVPSPPPLTVAKEPIVVGPTTYYVNRSAPGASILTAQSVSYHQIPRMPPLIAGPHVSLQPGAFTYRNRLCSEPIQRQQLQQQQQQQSSNQIFSHRVNLHHSSPGGPNVASGNGAVMNVSTIAVGGTSIPSNAELRRRLGASGTREVHNKLEKNRRAHLKECFELLKSQIPVTQDEKKTSNLTILRSAIRYVQMLRRREREFELEMERLTREKISKQHRMAQLKKELQSQWDHIDFNTLIPEYMEESAVMEEAIPLENGVSNQVIIENGVDSEEYNIMNNDHDQDSRELISDTDDTTNSSQLKSRTIYSSRTSSISSFSPPNTLNSNCSENVVYTNNHPTQLQILENYPSSSNGAAPAPQFISTARFVHIDGGSEPNVSLHNNNSNDKSSESTLKLIFPHGSTIKMFNDAFQKSSSSPVVLAKNRSPSCVAQNPITKFSAGNRISAPISVLRYPVANYSYIHQPSTNKIPPPPMLKPISHLPTATSLK